MSRWLPGTHTGRASMRESKRRQRADPEFHARELEAKRKYRQDNLEQIRAKDRESARKRREQRRQEALEAKQPLDVM